MNKLFLSPDETINELGTKEEFERSKELDEDGDDLLEDKLRAEYQEEMARDMEDEDMKEMLEENGLDEFDI